MDSPNEASEPNIANLTEDESEKLAQFKVLTGIDQVKCLQILRANDWNLEIALDLALDGAYNEDQTIYSHNHPSNDIDTSSNGSQLRHRNTTNASNPALTSSTNQDRSVSSTGSSPSNDDEPQGLHLVLWNAANWLFKLPFVIVINTLTTFYDFFSTLIRPALNYDSTGTVDRFVTEFEEKYGSIHPVFQRCSYPQLLDQGKRDIRFIVIYLHSPAHRDTDRFCTDVIATQRFADFISSENILFWSCSVYYPEGYRVFQSLKAGTYPYVALVGLKSHKMVMMKKLDGYIELDQFIFALKAAISNNEHSLIAARLDREERNMSSLIRAQQDEAFEESLRVDQEKERKKREAEEKKAEEERLAKEKEDAENRRQETLFQMKTSLLADIPAEPESNHAESLRIMFKLPNGKRLERRFLKSDPVKYLYFFVFCNEESLLNFKIRTNFPTRDLPGCSPAPETNLDSSEMNTLLEQCQLDNNIVLFVHDLDS